MIRRSKDFDILTTKMNRLNMMLAGTTMITAGGMQIVIILILKIAGKISTATDIISTRTAMP